MENKIKELIEKWKREYLEIDINGKYKDSDEYINSFILDLIDLLEFKPEDKSLIFAFVQGAKWWEYHKTKFTMWQSDTILAEEEAVRRLENNTLGKTVEYVINENAKDRTE